MYATGYRGYRECSSWKKSWCRGACSCEDGEYKVYNPLTQKVTFKANNVDPRTPLRQIHWVPDDPTESPLEPWDEFSRRDILLQPQPLDSSQSISQLQLDTNIGPDNVIEINVLRLTQAGRVSKTENPLIKKIERMIKSWNSQAKGEKQDELDCLTALIERNKSCLPDMEPMNKLLEVFTQAFEKTTALTREDFEGWLGYMEKEQLKALEFLMQHDLGDSDIVYFSEGVLRVLKGMNPMEGKITVVHRNGTESEKTINFNAPVWTIFPWVSYVKLDGVNQFGDHDSKYLIEFLSSTTYHINLNCFRSWLDLENHKARLTIIVEESDPRKHLLEKLKAEELYDKDLSQQLEEVKRVVQDELQSLNALEEGASFHQSSYTGPKYNAILSNIMTCLIKLYDELLKAKGNTDVQKTVEGWVDYMLKEKEVLLRILMNPPRFTATELCSQRPGGIPIVSTICDWAKYYFERTYLPELDTGNW